MPLLSILCSPSSSTCILLSLYAPRLFPFESQIFGRKEVGLSRGRFCYVRSDWSARSRKTGCGNDAAHPPIILTKPGTMSTSLLLRSTLPRHIARQPTLASAVWLRKAQASTTAATPQEEGEFKYIPGGRELFSTPTPSPRGPSSRERSLWITDVLFHVWLFTFCSMLA